MQATKPDVLDWFGLRASPFGGFRTGKEFYQSSEYRTAVRMIAFAVESFEMIALIGDVGSGKTEAVRAAMSAVSAEGMQVDFVRVEHPEKESMRIGSVLEALLNHFSEEGARLPQSAQRRTWLVKHHLISNHQQNRRTCLVIDEAHRLSGQFLKSLKELHETVRFGPHVSLFAVVLIGHRRLVERYKAVARDVWNRLDAGNIAGFGGFTPQEVSEYIALRCRETGAGELFSEQARLTVGRIASGPLEINRVCWRLMETACLEAEKQIDENLVLIAFDRAELAGRLGLSESEIAEMAGVSKTSVSSAFHGKAGKDATAAVDQVLREKAKGA